VIVRLGVHRSTFGATVVTVPLIDVMRPPDPAGMDTWMCRTVPAAVAVARYVSVAVPSAAAAAVMVTFGLVAATACDSPAAVASPAMTVAVMTASSL
jgi:hypothetical protein